MTNPDKPCPHANFDAVVEVNRLTKTDDGPVEAYSACIRVSCHACGEPFRWIGAPAGLSPARPTVSYAHRSDRHRPIQTSDSASLGSPSSR